MHQVRTVLTILCLICFSSSFSQITDDPNQSTKIPVVESDKKVDTSIEGEAKTLEEEDVLPLRVKKYTDSFDLTERKAKSFTMIQDNELINPGVIFEEKWRKKKPVAEVGMQYEKEMYFGEHRVKSEFLKIVFRDFGEEDGDLIRIFANDDVILPRVSLRNSSQAIKLELADGFNKIDFMALNQGAVGPNTAQFIIIDDKGEIIYNNAWNLAKGGRASIIFVKE